MSTKMYLDHLKEKYHCSLNTLAKQYGINPSTLNTLYTRNNIMSTKILEAISKKEGYQPYEILYFSLSDIFEGMEALSYSSKETNMYLCKMYCENYSVYFSALSNLNEQGEDITARQNDPYSRNFDGSYKNKRSGNGFSVVHSWDALEKEGMTRIREAYWKNDAYDVDSIKEQCVNSNQLIKIPKTPRTKYTHKKSGEVFYDLHDFFFTEPFDFGSLDWDNLTYSQFLSIMNREIPFEQYTIKNDKSDESLSNDFPSLDTLLTATLWIAQFDKEMVYTDYEYLPNINWYRRNYSTNKGISFNDFNNARLREGYIKFIFDNVIKPIHEECESHIINYVLVFKDKVLKQSVENALKSYRLKSKPKIQCEYIAMNQELENEIQLKLDDEVIEYFKKEFLEYILKEDISSIEHIDLICSFTKDAMINLIEGIDPLEVLTEIAKELKYVGIGDNHLKQYLIDYLKGVHYEDNFQVYIKENLRIISLFIEHITEYWFQEIYWNLLPLMNYYLQTCPEADHHLYHEQLFFYEEMPNGSYKIISRKEAGLEPTSFIVQRNLSKILDVPNDITDFIRSVQD